VTNVITSNAGFISAASVHVFPSRKSGLEFTALQGSRRLGRLICPSPRFVGIDSIPQTVDLFLVRGVCAAGTQLVRPPDEEQVHGVGLGPRKIGGTGRQRNDGDLCFVCL